MFFVRKLSAYFYITRPLNVFLVTISIFIGAFSAKPINSWLDTLTACISGALILAAGNVINDYFDVEVDKLNKVHRPIAAGLMRSVSARCYAIILFVLGVFLSIFISLKSFGVAVFVTGGLCYYSMRLKQTVLLGNLAVSLFSALAFIYGGLSAQYWLGAVIPATFAFFFHLGREIIKDIEDMDADAANGLRTLPVRFGREAALFVATIVFGLLVVLTFVPYFSGVYGKVYLLIVSLGVNLVIIFSFFSIWIRPVAWPASRASLILKIDMFIGLLAIVCGISMG